MTRFLKSLMMGASFVSTTFAADVSSIAQGSETEAAAAAAHYICGINLDKLPQVQEALGLLQADEKLAKIVGLFNKACLAMNRVDLVEQIKRDARGFLLSSEGDPSLKNSLVAMDELPVRPEEKENFREFLIGVALKDYAKEFEAFLADCHSNPEPFVPPLLGVLSLISGRGQTYTGCGAQDAAVSDQVRAILYNIFERTGLLHAASLARLRAPLEVTSEVRAFMKANPNVDTLIIAGSHVGPRTFLPYDPHRGALVVNPDPQRGADIIASIEDVLPHLPAGQFGYVIDDSNFWGELLTKDSIASNLFRILRSGGTIGDNTSNAYKFLIGAGFVGRFEECLDSDQYIEAIGVDCIHNLDLEGLRRFLGEGLYKRLVESLSDKLFIANLFAEVDAVELPLTEETKVSYFIAYRSLYKSISDKAALLHNVEDGSVYERDGVFKLVAGKIHLLNGFIKP